MADSDRPTSSSPPEPSPRLRPTPDVDRGQAPDGGPLNPPPPRTADEEIIRLRAEIARVSRLVQTANTSREVEGLRRKITDARAEADRDTADVLATARRDAAALIGNLRREMTDAVADRLRVVDTTQHEHQVSLQRLLARVGRNENTPVAWHSLNALQAADEWARLAGWIEDVYVPWNEISLDPWINGAGARRVNRESAF